MMQDGNSALKGWFTTRWVEAADEAKAKAVVLDVLKSELPSDRAMWAHRAAVSWEEIEIVDESEVPETQGGFTFFPMEN